MSSGTQQNRHVSRSFTAPLCTSPLLAHNMADQRSTTHISPAPAFVFCLFGCLWYPQLYSDLDFFFNRWRSLQEKQQRENKEKRKRRKKKKKTRSATQRKVCRPQRASCFPLPARLRRHVTRACTLQLINPPHHLANFSSRFPFRCEPSR